MCSSKFWEIENRYLTPPEPVLSSVVCEECGEYIPIGNKVFECCMGHFCEDCLHGMSALDFVQDILCEKLIEVERD